jgi:hypothetical protein
MTLLVTFDQSNGCPLSSLVTVTRPARTSGAGRSDLYGGLEESFGVNAIYQAGGRFVMDVQGLFWKVECVGLGAQYFWGISSRRIVRNRGEP